MRVSHLMYAKQFKLLRERLSGITLADIDPKIANLVVAINKCDDLVTVFSCQGHDDKEDWDTPYVMVGVRNFDHMYKLYEFACWEFGKNKHMLNLSMTMRQDFLSPPHKRTGERGWWAVWNISWKVSTEVTREMGWTYMDLASARFEEWLQGNRMNSK